MIKPLTAPVFLAATLGLVPIGIGAEERAHELVLSHTSAPGTPIYLTYERFKEEVEDRSGGTITVRIHHSASLAGDTQGVELLQSGALDIASAGTNNMSQFTDLFLVFDLPYIFEDSAATHRVLNGDVGEEIKESFEAEQNLKLLFYADPGSQRDVMNTEHEVRVPDDISGMRFRSAESPIEIATIEALGAVAIPISWVEVYSALEQGVIQGQLQQYHWAVTANHEEIIKHVTETGGIHAIHLAIMNLNTFNDLSGNQQQAVLEAAEVAQDFNFSNAPGFVEDLRQEMIDGGVEVLQLTDEEREQWVSAATAVWDDFRDQIPDGLIERIQEAQ